MKIYVNIKKKPLSVLKKDFFQKFTDSKTGEQFERQIYCESAFEDCTKEDLVFLAKRNSLGIFIKPRFTFLIELRTSFRDENKKVKNKVIFAQSINSETLNSKNDSALKKISVFWWWLERELKKSNVESANKIEIIKKIESAVPRLTDEELARIET
jgi:hypothetical protein